MEIILGVILTAVSIEDFLYGRIRNVYCVCLILLWIINIQNSKTLIVDGIIAALLISIFMFGVTFIMKKGFAGGDIKMMFAAGLLLGVRRTFYGFSIAIIISSVIAITRLIKKNKGPNDKLAMGPALSIGIMFSYIHL